MGPPTHLAPGLRMLFKLKPGPLVPACEKLEVCLVLTPHILAHRWIFPRWTAGVSCSLCFLQSCFCSASRVDLRLMLQVVSLQSRIWPYLLLRLLAHPWMAPGLDAPPHLPTAGATSSGPAGLFPVSGATLSSWLILRERSCSSPRYKCLPCWRKKAASSTVSPAWFLIAKSDVPPPPGCRGERNEFSISCWVCDVPQVVVDFSGQDGAVPLRFARGICLGYDACSAALPLNKQWEESPACSAPGHRRPSSRTIKYRTEGLKG